MRDIIQHLQGRQYIYWLLDYDGTLSPLVVDPDAAFLPKERQQFLTEVAKTPGHRLAIVSGRSVDQLRSFLPHLAGHPILFSGLHGGELFDVKTGQYLQIPGEAFLTGVAQFKALLTQCCPTELNAGALLEDKRYAIAFHYRGLQPDLIAPALERVEAIYHAEPDLTRHFRLHHGNCLLELIPHTFHKGIGIKTVLDNQGGTTAFPVYIGDDTTDDDAFFALNELGGLSVQVGTNPAILHAKANLENIEAVYRLLGNFVM